MHRKTFYLPALVQIVIECIFQAESTFFSKTGCTFPNNTIIFKSSLISFDDCAALCDRDKECFSFQYNEETDTCKISKWYILNVRACDPVQGTDKAVYVKEAVHFCPFGFDFSFDGSCYFYSGPSVGLEHSEASQVCKSLGGYLVSINTKEENTKLFNHLVSLKEIYTTHYWLGGTRVPGTGNPGTWVWEDGTDVKFANWTYGEPGGYYANQMCMDGRKLTYRYMYWGDNSCKGSFPYICEIQISDD